MAGEGNPVDPAQARMQMSIHVKVVGLLLVQRGTFQPASSLGQHLQVITRWNAVGTVMGSMRAERQKQLLSMPVYGFGQLLTPRITITMLLME
jgi:hypothetical protein